MKIKDEARELRVQELNKVVKGKAGVKGLGEQLLFGRVHVSILVAGVSFAS